MNMTRVIKLDGAIWEIERDLGCAIKLRKNGVLATFFPKRMKLVFRNIFTGQFMSRKVRRAA